MITKKLKTEIYHEIIVFLEAYKTENTQVLKERFDIQGEFLEEIYEMLDFVKDKNDLQLFSIEEMDDEVLGCKNLNLFDEEEYFDPDEPTILVECCLYLNKKRIAIIVGEYNNDDTFPKFLFQYFDI
ncbi:MAG: hypothetical protein Q4C98_10515 [Capnocytophaga sp.]|nr:hypothetical protein [Capnocytophaga sp.]